MGPFIHAILRSGARHIFAAYPGNGFLVVGEEEPASVVLASRHFQSPGLSIGSSACYASISCCWTFCRVRHAHTHFGCLSMTPVPATMRRHCKTGTDVACKLGYYCKYALLLKLSLIGATPEAWERAVLRLTSNHTHDDVLPHWLELRHENPVSRSNTVRQLIAAARFQAPQAKPMVPTLLLASEQDHLVSVNCSKTLSRHWQCDLRVHSSVGHDLPLDDGPWVAARVRVWLPKGFENERGLQ